MKGIDSKILEKNLQITSLTREIDLLRASKLDLTNKLKEVNDHHESFVIQLTKQVMELKTQLEDLQMDMCRDELDKNI
jgi:uncharacterized sporulation protein YeaH/YhbH (DUF444 family)|tara:strand:- start:316 stop:549 length:234 start_codon:yes stop_codon:yes gene_type:complete